MYPPASTRTGGGFTRPRGGGRWSGDRRTTIRSVWLALSGFHRRETAARRAAVFVVGDFHGVLARGGASANLRNAERHDVEAAADEVDHFLGLAPKPGVALDFLMDTVAWVGGVVGFKTVKSTQ